MADEGPERWIGKRVKVYLFHAGVPDVDTHVTDLRGVSALGITVDGIPAGRLFFYPWNAVRQIEYELSEEEQGSEEDRSRVARATSIRPRR